MWNKKVARTKVLSIHWCCYSKQHVQKQRILNKNKLCLFSFSPDPFIKHYFVSIRQEKSRDLKYADTWAVWPVFPCFFGPWSFFKWYVQCPYFGPNPSAPNVYFDTSVPQVVDAGHSCSWIVYHAYTHIDWHFYDIGAEVIGVAQN